MLEQSHHKAPDAPPKAAPAPDRPPTAPGGRGRAASLQALELTGRLPPVPIDPGDPADAARAQSLEVALAWGGADGPASARASHAGLMAAVESSRGAPLDPAESAYMAAQLGHDFAGVRVHADGPAAEAAEGIGAEAFTVGRGIFYGRGAPRPGSAGGDRLLAHELQHVVQHDEGRATAGAVQGRGISRPDDALEREAEQVAEGIGPRDGSAPAAVPDAAATPRAAPADAPVMRSLLGDFVDGIGDAAGDTWDGITEAAGDAWDAVTEFGEDQIRRLVEAHAPGLLPVIDRGLVGYLWDVLYDGVIGWLGGLLGDLGVADLLTAFGAVFTEVTTVLAGLATGDAACCEAFAGWLDGIAALVTGVLESPFITDLVAFAEGAQSALVGLAAVAAEPALDLLEARLGADWALVTGAVDGVSAGLGIVADLGSAAWDWVAGALGLDGEGGVWGALEEVAADVLGVFAPWLGPLETLTGALDALLGFEALGALLDAGAAAWETVTFLAANWDAEDLPARAEEAGLVWLPELITAVQGLGAAFDGAVRGLGAIAASAWGGLMTLVGQVAATPWLTFLLGALMPPFGLFSAVYAWCEGDLSTLGARLSAVGDDIAAFAEPIIDVLGELAILTLNPAGIVPMLAGDAWQALPDCIKPPIVDCVLDIAIAALDAAPDLLVFGPIWLLMKPGLIGFLEQVRGEDDETKIAVTNKAARILGGDSPEFMIGFVGGCLKGIWEGITDPFVLAWTLLTGLGDLGAWLLGGARSADSHPGDDDTGATLAGAVAGEAVAGMASGGATDEGITPISTAGLPAEAERSVQRAVEAERVAAEPEAPTGRAVGRGAGDAARAVGGGAAGAVAGEAAGLWADVGPRFAALGAAFLPAVEEFFAGGGLSFADLVDKLGEVWPEVEAAMAGAGAALAEELVAWFGRDEAESELGSAVGWLVGTVVFEAVLFYFTAGAGTAIVEGSRVLKTLLKIVDWTGEAFGLAMKGLVKLGRLLLEVGKAFAKVFSAAGGKLKALLDEVIALGQRLVDWARDMLRRGRRGADDAADEPLEEAAEEVAEHTPGAPERPRRPKGGGEAGHKQQALAIGRAVSADADRAEWNPAVLHAALTAVAGGFRAVKQFDVEHVRGPWYAVTMIASRHPLGNVHLDGDGEEKPGEGDGGDDLPRPPKQRPTEDRAPAERPEGRDDRQTEQRQYGVGELYSNHVDGVCGLAAELDRDGVLNLYIKVGPTTPKGAEMFSEAVCAFGQNIKAVRGRWLNRDGLADNFDSYRKALAGGLTKDEAAFATFTGKMARRHGFINAKVLGDTPEEVVAVFYP